LQRSDKLLVLQDGRAVTFGARDDVLQRLLRAARTAAETPNLARTLANPASSASALTGA
jgi:ABC-type protease/lipase transport system fused ATPase/permease subunit